MVETVAQEQAVSDSFLCNAADLKLVLDVVGADSFIFVAPVSKSFASAYRTVERRMVRADDRVRRYSHKVFSVEANMTTVGSVITSVARIKVATACGWEINQPWHPDMQLYIGRNASIEVLQHLIEAGLRVTDSITAGVASRGDLSTLKSFHLQFGLPLTQRVAHGVARRGDLEALQWLKQHGIHFDRECAVEAARGGHTHLCQYFHAEGVAWDRTVMCRGAAQGGHLDTLQWLVEQGTGWDEDMWCYIHAASGGHIHIMGYLLQLTHDDNKASQLRFMLYVAGSSCWSQLQAAKWCREQGAEWPEYIGAIDMLCCENWYGDVLEWARTEGCTASTEYDNTREEQYYR